jgi:hypothetical protein
MSAKLPLLSAAALALTLGYTLKRLSKTHPPLPPGPPAEPLIGHLRVFPTEDRELFFHELGKVYGACIVVVFLRFAEGFFRGTQRLFL